MLIQFYFFFEKESMLIQLRCYIPEFWKSFIDIINSSSETGKKLMSTLLYRLLRGLEKEFEPHWKSELCKAINDALISRIKFETRLEFVNLLSLVLGNIFPYEI